MIEVNSRVGSNPTPDTKYNIMRSIPFPEANMKIAENQEEFQTIHAKGNTKDMSVTFCFSLNKEELEEVARTGEFWIKQVTGGKKMQPIHPSAFKSEVITE